MTPQERADRRALIKAHHPDRGGDPATFVEVLAALDRPTTPSRAGSVEARPSPSWRRRRRQVVRDLQQRLPRGVPGARRYATY